MIRAAVITVSDTRMASDDASGDRLEALLADVGADVVIREIYLDELVPQREALAALATRDDIDLILTTGGTGFGPRDNTPEATRAVIEREAPGLAEAMRRETAVKTPMA